jgi:glycosyltransferase involved in cell wall biosynthesis
MVTFEHHFISAPEGRIYTRGTVDYSFLSRYLGVFDEVIVLGRVEDACEIPPDAKAADGPNVSFLPVPYYFGPVGLLKRYREVRASIRRAIDAADAYILRVASVVSTQLWHHLMRRGTPYGVEVVGDPWDVFSPGSIKTKLRPLLRRKMTWDLVRQCRAASVASYVTEHTLQKRYPSRCWSTHYSSIDLPAEMIVDESVIDKRIERIEAKTNAGKPIRLCFVGSVSRLYKAPDILISSVADCIRKGSNIELVMLGDGQYRRKLEEQAQNLGIAEKVLFLGNVPSGKAVYEQLDQADLFVLPSWTEGLPRSIIEAMARALPCIGSAVGGIPELLDDEYLVPPGKVQPLAKKIERIVGDTKKLRQMSSRNLQKAHEYCIDELNKRRNEFYQKLSDITGRWHSANQAR